MIVSRTFVQSGPAQPPEAMPFPKAFEAMQIDLAWMKYKVKQIDKRLQALEAASGIHNEPDPNEPPEYVPPTEKK